MVYSAQEIVNNGTLIESWPCDVNDQNEMQSNGSQEFMYTYKGYLYITWMNWDNEPINPNEMLEPINNGHIELVEYTPQAK